MMLSMQGFSQMAFYRPPAELVRRVAEEGFVITGRNAALDGLIESEDYYIDVIHSRDYIKEQWGRYFTVVDIVDAIAANQDVVVLRNDG